MYNKITSSLYFSLTFRKDIIYFFKYNKKNSLPYFLPFCMHVKCTKCFNFWYTKVLLKVLTVNFNNVAEIIKKDREDFFCNVVLNVIRQIPSPQICYSLIKFFCYKKTIMNRMKVLYKKYHFKLWSILLVINKKLKSLQFQASNSKIHFQFLVRIYILYCNYL